MHSSSFPLNNFVDCFKPVVPKPNPDPTSTLQKYTKSCLLDRCKFLSAEPCKNKEFAPINSACAELGSYLQNFDRIIMTPGKWAKGQNLLQKNFKFPYPDDTDSPSKNPECGSSVDQNGGWCCPPAPLYTTYCHYYHPHQILPPPHHEGGHMNRPTDLIATQRYARGAGGLSGPLPHHQPRIMGRW